MRTIVLLVVCLWALIGVQCTFVDDFTLGFDWPTGFHADPLFSISSLSSTQNKQWSLFNQTYHVPDIFDIQATPSAVIQSTVHQISSLQDYISYYGCFQLTTIGLPIVLPLGLGMTHLAAGVKLALSVSSNMVFLNVAQVSFFALAMWPPEIAKISIPALSTLDVSDSAAVKSFFSTYGTHYNQRVGLGVEVVYVISVNSTVVGKLGADGVHNQVGLWIHAMDFLIGLRMSYNYAQLFSQLDPTFTAGMTAQVFLNGNPVDPHTLSAETLNLYALSSPYPVLCNRRPITDFGYVLQNDTAQQLLEQAWTEYMMTQSNSSSSSSPSSISSLPPRKYSTLSSPGVEELKQTVKDVKNVNNAPFPYGHTPAPGADFVGAGYDASTMESTVLRVAANTFWLPRVWQDPLDDDIVYQIPDSMNLADTDEGCMLSGVSMVDDESTLISTFHKQEGSFWGLGFSSKNDYQFQERYFVKNQSMVLNSTCNTVYALEVFPPYQQQDLDPKFVALVNSLPVNYSSDPTDPSNAAYQRFLSFMGTHYATQATMGATSKAVLWYHRCFLTTESDQWVTKMSGFSFLGLINHLSGSESGQNNDTQLFDEYSDFYVELHGGNALLFPLNLDGGQAWTDSIKDHLVPLDNVIEPLDSLVTWDNKLQANIQAAISDYMSQAAKANTQRVQSFIPMEPVTPPAWCQ